MTRLGRPVIRFDSVPSTMDVLDELARLGASEGTVVVAEHQSAGRGRAGRVWAAIPGTSLLMSLLLRPRRPGNELSPLSMLAAFVLVRVLERHHGIDAVIKWPNDVLIGERKVSGVLLRVGARVNHPDPDVLLGMGVNLNSSLDDLPPTATSLSTEVKYLIDRDVFLRVLLGELEVVYDAFLRNDLALMWSAVDEHLAFRGESVEVIDGNRVMHGAISGVDRSGALLLRQPDGTNIRVVAGDVVRGPRRVERAG